MALDSLGTSSKLSGRVTAALECSAVREDLSAEADGHPLLVILSEDVSAVHLEMLRKNHVSWIATGKNHIDLQRAVEILAEQFKVSRLVLVGGGNSNGGFLEAGLVDEVSVISQPHSAQT